ncbi:MAG TPA: acetate/propionate family kinase [Stellaceae bacterium]|nr:acetate/propionate family kinase [Stellaceae bacterium]
MSDTVLCLNAGSSSIKFELFEVMPRDELQLAFRGQLEGIGARPRLTAKRGSEVQLADRTYTAQEIPNVAAAMPKLTEWLREHLQGKLPIVIGHRLVFGGTRYSAPVVIDDDCLRYLHSVVPLMPLHLPSELAPVELIHQRLPNMPQVAVFDTGFHRGHDELVQRLPIPESLHREGVLSYGFHGISYEFIAARLKEIDPALADRRVIVAHLGSGCSMCALVGGRSVDASWGFSALDGLPMGTRPGRLDPGVILYLLQVKRMSVEQVQDLLYHECGLKGLSGVSNDVRELLASADPRARLALDSFSLRCARMVAELATVMGGLDGLVFTAGIGERAAPLRASIGSRLSWLGVAIDAEANARHGPRISSSDSRVACYVIPTNEELMIARHALALVARRPDSPQG